MTAERRTVWVCPVCEWHFDEPGYCPGADCGRKLVERHVYLCPNFTCGQRYPDNRRPPERCYECGEELR